MARFQWFNGNQGIYGFDQFNQYVELSRSTTGLVLGFDATRGPFDPQVQAAQIEMTYAGYKTAVIGAGPQAGGFQVIGGVLTGLRYLAADGSLLVEITGLAVSLPVALATLHRGDGAGLWQMICNTGGTFLGSGSAVGPGHPQSGDVIDTGARADSVSGFGGDDFMQDRGGADHYNGGTGFDTVSYSSWFYRPSGVTGGITADLVLGTVSGPDGTADQIQSIEAVYGTFLADNIKGNASANSFIGFAGYDRFDGRGGFDMVSYDQDITQGGLDGIKVNLFKAQIRDGFGYLDKVISVEGVEGTSAADIFLDNALDNYFQGNGGDDLFSFGAGNDTGRGGAGADVFAFRGLAFGDDTVQDFDAAAGDSVQIVSVTSFAQLIISTVTVNGGVAAFVECAAGSVTLMGVTAGQLTATDFGF